MLRALVDTPAGRRLRIIRGPAEAEAAANELAATDAIEWPYPPVYGCGIRYQRENPRNHSEDWKDADRLVRDGVGDCEDLVAARVGELVMSGVDPDARPVVYRPRPGLMHVVVRRGDGSIEDPSAILGMGKMGKILLKSRRLRRGQYEVGAAVPFAGSHFPVSAIGISRADAARSALADAVGFLSEIGAWDELRECGYQLPGGLDVVDRVGAERMGDADFEAWAADAKAQVNELRSEYGVVVGRVLGGLAEIDWSDWKDNPTAFTNKVVGMVQSLVGSMPGPAGPVLSWLMEFGVWLSGKYPAVAVMVWQDAFVYCARGLGYTEGDNVAKVGAMLMDGWICFDATKAVRRFNRPEGAPDRGEGERADMEEVLTTVLAPISGMIRGPILSVSSGLVFSGPLASWMQGRERARALLDADAVRVVEVQSKTNKKHDAICFKLQALPADMIDMLALYVPLGGNAAAIRARGLNPNPPDEGVRRVIGYMGGSGFDASGGGQGFTGLNVAFPLKILSELRPGGEPLAQPVPGGLGALGLRRAEDRPTGQRPVGKPSKKNGLGALLLPALGLGALALLAAGDEEDQGDEPGTDLGIGGPRAPLGTRTTGGRGARMARGLSAEDGAAIVPDKPPALSPDTADRLVSMLAASEAVANGAIDALRELTRGNATLARFVREIRRG